MITGYPMNPAAERAMNCLPRAIEQTVHRAAADVAGVSWFEPDGIGLDRWEKHCGGTVCVDEERLLDITSKLVTSGIKKFLDASPTDPSTLARLWAEAEEASKPLAGNFLKFFPTSQRGKNTTAMVGETSCGFVVIQGALSLHMPLKDALKIPAFKEATDAFGADILKPLAALVTKATRSR